MTNTHTTSSVETDTAIDRLLIKAEPVSIVDGLFELAAGETDNASAPFDRALYGRLQARLAERIRLEMSREAP